MARRNPATLLGVAFLVIVVLLGAGLLWVLITVRGISAHQDTTSHQDRQTTSRQIRALEATVAKDRGLLAQAAAAIDALTAQIRASGQTPRPLPSTTPPPTSAPGPTTTARPGTTLIPTTTTVCDLLAHPLVCLLP